MTFQFAIAMLTNTRTSSWVNALVNTRMNLKLAGFAGLVTAATAWTLWGGEMFPAEPDPTGGSTVVCDTWLAGC